MNSGLPACRLCGAGHSCLQYPGSCPGARLAPPASSSPHLSHTLDLPDPGLKVRTFILALASEAMMVHQVPLSLPQSFPSATWAARFFTGESWLFPFPDPYAFQIPAYLPTPQPLESKWEWKHTSPSFSKPGSLARAVGRRGRGTVRIITKVLYLLGVAQNPILSACPNFTQAMRTDVLLFVDCLKPFH